MKKVLYFMSLMCVMMLASCSSDIEDFVPGSSGDEITIGVGIPESNGTRVSTADLLDLTWESGDRILLLGYDSNNTYVGRSESSEIKSGAGTKKALFDVNTIPNATKYKIFYKGTNVNINDNGSLNIDYLNQLQNAVNDSKHIKSTFALGSDEISAANINKGANLAPLNAVMRINIKDIYKLDGICDANKVGSIDLSIGDKNPACLFFKGYKQVSINKGQDNYFYMSFDPSADLAQGGVLKVSIDSRIAEIMSTDGKDYKAGKIYNITLGTKENGKWGFLGDNSGSEVLPDPSKVDWRNKTVWVSGVTVPSLDLWGINYGESIGLEWTRGQGWYDCTKLEPGEGGIDSRYCWAATCSNMIYWWLDQNKENVDKYGYTGPKEYVSALDCEIFQYFKDHFTNNGCMIENGFDWFFKGKHIYGDSNNAISNENAVNGWPKHTGFFKDVVGTSKLYRKCGGGEDFEENLKIALINNESIGLDISLKNGTGAHAITIWGASFDQNGNVCELYEVENNDIGSLTGGFSPTTPGKTTNLGMFSHKIKLIKGEYTLESSVAGKYNVPIRYAYFMGTYSNQWESFWKNKGK